MQVKTLLIILSTLLILTGCTKNKNDIIITGKVFSPNEQSYISGVKISLEGQLFENNTWNSNYSTIASTYSDASGSYTIEHESVRTNGMRLKAEKQNYITKLIDINYEEIVPGEEFPVNINIYPSAFLLITIKNVLPANESDELTVNLTLGTDDCPTCLHSGNTTFEGADVNDTIFGMVYGEKDYTVKWTVNNNGNIELHSQNVHCGKSDTATVNISY